MNEKQTKPVVWIGSSHEDWKDFPDDVQDVMSYVLHLAQFGRKRPSFRHAFSGGLHAAEQRTNYAMSRP